MGQIYELIDQITPHLQLSHSPLFLGIDGPCASGKTTLASHLSAHYNATVVHMDDFYLPLDRRGEIDQVASNIDTSRLITEVLQPLSNGKPCIYQAYCCRTGEFLPPVMLFATPLVIVEGVYTFSPRLFDYFQLRLFVEAPWSVREARLLERGGTPLLSRFLSEWIVRENQYFKTCETKSQCNLVYKPENEFTKNT